MRRIVVVVAVFLFVTTTKVFSQNTLERLPAMPTERSRLASAFIDGKLYVVGGMTAGKPTSRLDMFDPYTNGWKRLADMPTARYDLAVAAIDGKLYAIGGSDFRLSYSVERYDPATDLWEKLPNIQTARNRAMTGVIDGKLYIFGGTRNTGVELTQTERYDPESNQWRRMSDMIPAGRDYVGCVFNGKLLAIRGKSDASYPATAQQYDPNSDRWVGLRIFPEAESVVAAAVLDGNLFLIGRGGKVDRLNSTLNRWEQVANIPTNRSQFAVSGHDGAFYLIGWQHGSAALSTIERLTLFLFLVPTHPDPKRVYNERVVEAIWSPVPDCNGYLWQISRDSVYLLTPPPIGQDWWTSEPKLSWSLPEGGTWWLHMCILDADARPARTFRREIRVLGPPEISSPTHPDPSLIYPFPIISVNWGQPGIDTLYALIDGDSRTVPTRTNAAPYLSSPIRFRNQPEGTRYIHLRASDDTGVLGPVVHFPVNIGTMSAPTPPVVESEDVDAIAREVAQRVQSATSPGAQVTANPMGNLPPLAVLDFDARTGVSRDEASILGGRLRNALVDRGTADVYEREKVETILREQEFQHSDCTAAECAVEIGQLVNVQWVVVGEVGKLGAMYTMSARMIDVATGKVVRTSDSPGAASVDVLIRYLPSMAAKLLAG